MKTDSLLDAFGLIDESFLRQPERRQKPVKKAVLKRALTLAASLALCLALAVPALAAVDFGPAYTMLYAVSPAAAQKLKPVRMVSEDQGIQMEVLSASTNGNKADIYLALRDLTGDRIDETTDLFDSYTIHRAFDSSASCECVSYDPAKKEASFLIHIEGHRETDLMGNKITFSVARFLSRKNEFHAVLPALDLSKVAKDPVILKNVTGFAFRGGGFSDISQETMPPAILKPQEKGLFSPLPGVTVTAMGYTEGKLHIQAYYEDILKTDNHGFFSLTDQEGTTLLPLYSLSFWDREQKGSFEEYVFPVSEEDLGQYRVFGEFWTCDTLIKGNWQVTFSLAEK